MLKDFGYMHAFPQNLAQINIKSKLCHPFQNNSPGLLRKRESNEKLKENVKSFHSRVEFFLQENNQIINPLCSAFVHLITSPIVPLKLDTLVTQQWRIHFLNLWVPKDKMLYFLTCSTCTEAFTAYHSTKGWNYLDYKLGNRYCICTGSTRNHPGFNCRRFFFFWNLFFFF